MHTSFCLHLIYNMHGWNQAIKHVMFAQVTFFIIFIIMCASKQWMKKMYMYNVHDSSGLLLTFHICNSWAYCGNTTFPDPDYW